VRVAVAADGPWRRRVSSACVLTQRGESDNGGDEKWLEIHVREGPFGREANAAGVRVQLELQLFARNDRSAAL
jgi:hypothetical protein